MTAPDAHPAGENAAVRKMRPDLTMANPDCEFCHGTGREATVPPGGTFPCSAGCEEEGGQWREA